MKKGNRLLAVLLLFILLFIFGVIRSKAGDEYFIPDELPPRITITPQPTPTKTPKNHQFSVLLIPNKQEVKPGEEFVLYFNLQNIDKKLVKRVDIRILIPAGVRVISYKSSTGVANFNTRNNYVRVLAGTMQPSEGIEAEVKLFVTLESAKTDYLYSEAKVIYRVKNDSRAFWGNSIRIKINNEK